MYYDGSVQDCSISIANALEILQFYTKPSSNEHKNFDKILSILVIITVPADGLAPSSAKASAGRGMTSLGAMPKGCHA